jgi:2-keto-4-pentenoate hydratase/2-oxohepta-3-ene-1,7-dioic acid hydratase in catechol pathway
VTRPSNFIAIGLNYADHAAEAGMKLPPEPIIFNKALSCICGPNDNTITPEGLDQARLRGRARHRDRLAAPAICRRTRR